MALPGNTDSRGVRLPPLHAEGSGQHAAELPGLVPGQRDACAIEGGEAGDPKVGFVTCQELDWYQQPLPESVDHSVPDIGKAWAWFLEIDRDRSGVIEFSELCTLSKALGLDWGKRRLRKAYDEMCQGTPFGNREGVTFDDFASWWARYEVMRRRDVGRVVKELFQNADVDGSGILDKEEFHGLLQRANAEKSIRRHTIRMPKRFMTAAHVTSNGSFRGGSLRVPDGGKELAYASESNEEVEERNFELEEAWQEIRKVPLDADGETLGVNFSGFENWWKLKTGMIDPDIPVLPEFMVLRIGDKVKAERAWSAALDNKATAASGPRSSQKWSILRDKLLALVRMKSSWGELHDIYVTRHESLFEENPLPPWVRDPDTNSAAIWDLCSVFFLFYVSFTVPLRVCFSIDLQLWSLSFWVEMVVDMFFICDVILNFRTSYYDANGFRENRPSRITQHYLRSWFLIDFVSCLPYGYVQYFFPHDADDNSSQLKAIKAVRLMKITKMMRLARIKRLVMRYGGDGSFQLWQSAVFTVFTIVFLAHILACFWYLVGINSEQLGTGTVVRGWVEQQDAWEVTLLDTNWTDISDRVLVINPSISVSVRYLASMCYSLNALENAYTSLEMGFSVFAELVRDVILGLVASLITTISISISSTDTETEIRLRRLRSWMAEKKLPKAFRKQALEHFTDIWTTNYMHMPSLLTECPPAMASKMAVLLYGRYVATVPLFKGLSQEVLSALCLKCQPMSCMKNQNIIQEREPGREMYMVLKGEVEVSQRRGSEVVRLGFLAEGAFFGEAPVLGWLGEPGVELRMRTVRAVTDVELIYLSRDDVSTLCEQYAELRARMSRFEKSGRILTKKTLRKIDLSVEEVKQMANGFKSKVELTAAVRAKKGLQSDSYVRRGMLPTGTTTVLMAASRFKKAGAARRARAEDERQEKAAQLEEKLNERGGIGSLLLESKENQTNMAHVQEQLKVMQEMMKTHFEQANAQSGTPAAPATEPGKQLDVEARAEAAEALRRTPGIMKLIEARIFKFDDFMTDGTLDIKKLDKVRGVLAKRADRA